MTALESLENAGWRVVITPGEKINLFLFEAYPPESDARSANGGRYALQVDMPGHVDQSLRGDHIEKLALNLCREEGITVTQTTGGWTDDSKASRPAPEVDTASQTAQDFYAKYPRPGLPGARR